jgi:hypothetical protein
MVADVKQLVNRQSLFCYSVFEKYHITRCTQGTRPRTVKKMRALQAGTQFCCFPPLSSEAAEGRRAAVNVTACLSVEMYVIITSEVQYMCFV